MINIIFKNLDSSELAKDITHEKISEIIHKFPKLRRCSITVTLSMDNSPTQGGADIFSVMFRCTSGPYKGIILTKSAISLYVALSEVSEHLLERLNRFGDKNRVKKIKQARLLQKRVLAI